MPIQKINDNIYTFEFSQKIVPGVYFPTRSTIICLDEETVAVIAAGPFDEETIKEISALGSKFYIIAPNLFHHFYFLKAKDSFPNATLFAPESLGKKIKQTAGQYKNIKELPETVTQVLKPIFIEGNKTLDEWVFFHPKTKTLVLTDLVFNMRDRPFFTKLLLQMVGAYNKIGQSKLIRSTISDFERFNISIKGLKKLNPDKIMLAHGDIITNPSEWQDFVQNYKVR